MIDRPHHGDHWIRDDPVRGSPCQQQDREWRHGIGNDRSGQSCARRLQVRLEFRRGGGVGANAFALPDGIVIVTGEIVALARHDDLSTHPRLAERLGHSGERPHAER